MISFVRVDDRMIHGQTVTRWSLEYPCTGLIAVNDAAAKNPVLKGAYKSASDKKTFVWAVDEFIAKAPKVLESKDKYFLISQENDFWQYPEIAEGAIATFRADQERTFRDGKAGFFIFVFDKNLF